MVTRAFAAPDLEIRRLLEPPARERSRSAGRLVPAGLAGIEQEYGVWVDGRQVAFEDLIDQVAPPGAVRRVAFDARARVVRSGAVWTVDTPHAEVATPPRVLGRGVASRLADDALAERAALLHRLETIDRKSGTGGRYELRGYSTHLNAAADGIDGWSLVERFATTYAPALMLLTDRAGSPGLLVRPRPGRLELGTEFLESHDDLVAASVVALAATIATYREVASPDAIGAGSSPKPLRSDRFGSPWQRPGVFVPRDAFGDDLYEHVRDARLTTVDGRVERAGDRLVATWRQLRLIAAGFATGRELALVDDLVTGRRPLPLERSEPQDPLVRTAPRSQRVRTWLTRARPEASVRVLETRRRGSLRLRPEYVTWDQAILRVTAPGRTFFVGVPRDDSERFLGAWASGRLDAPMARFAEPAVASSGRVAALDVAEAGLFDAVEPPDLAISRLEPAKGPGEGGSKRPTPIPGIPMSVTVPMPVGPPTGSPLAPTAPPSGPRPPAGPRPRPPWQRPWPWLTALTVIVILIWQPWQLGAPPGGSAAPSAVESQPGSSGSPDASAPQSACPPNDPCASATAGPSGATSPGPTQPGPSAGASATGSEPPSQPPGSGPPPTTGPTATPSLQPTPPPDTTGPQVSDPTWAPDPIGVPLPQVQACSPNSGLGQTVTVSVAAGDPSGVASVALRYRRAGDAAPITVAMTASGAGTWGVDLSTADDPTAWWPVGNDLSYVVDLSVRAVDGVGNATTTAAVLGFTVTFCQ